MLNELEYILKNTKICNPIPEQLGGCIDAQGTVGDGQYFAIDLTPVNLGTKIYDIGGKNILKATTMIFKDIYDRGKFSFLDEEERDYKGKAKKLAKKTVTVDGVIYRLSNYEQVKQDYHKHKSELIKVLKSNPLITKDEFEFLME